MAEYINEVNSLKAHVADLEKVIEELQKKNSSMAEAIEIYLNKISDFNTQIEFYKGQIQAYQYCMSCRRV